MSEHSSKEGKSAATSDSTRITSDFRQLDQQTDAELMQRARVAPMALGARQVLHLQRTFGNQVVTRLMRPVVQRTIKAALTAEPGYRDGLSLATITSSALDKEVVPGNAKAIKKWEKQNNKPYDATDPMWLKSGQVHGNTAFANKEGVLPAGGATYVEYDVGTYTPGTSRGTDRVVIGTAANGTKTYYYTNDHYKSFAPFTPAGAVAPTPVATAVATPTPVATTP